MRQALLSVPPAPLAASAPALVGACVCIAAPRSLDPPGGCRVSHGAEVQPEPPFYGRLAQVEMQHAAAVVAQEGEEDQRPVGYNRSHLDTPRPQEQPQQARHRRNRSRSPAAGEQPAPAPAFFHRPGFRPPPASAPYIPPPTFVSRPGFRPPPATPAPAPRPQGRSGSYQFGAGKCETPESLQLQPKVRAIRKKGGCGGGNKRPTRKVIELTHPILPYHDIMNDGYYIKA